MKPQLGHYVEKHSYTVPTEPISYEVRVVPPATDPTHPEYGYVRLYVNGATVLLRADVARRIAHGLIICADRAAYPLAVAGSEP